jgi:hypothetical protein
MGKQRHGGTFGRGYVVAVRCALSFALTQSVSRGCGSIVVRDEPSLPQCIIAEDKVAAYSPAG